MRYIGSILLLLGATSFAIFSEENTFRAKTYVPSPSSVPSPSLKGNYPKVTDIPLIFIGKNEKIKLSEVEDDLRKNKGGDYDPNRVANDTERLLKTGKYSFAKVFASHESIEAGGILIRRAVALQLNKAERKEPHYGDPIIATLNNRSLKLASKKLNAIPVVAEKDQEKDVDDYISLGSLLSETVWKEVELVTDKDQGRLSSDSFNESIAKLRKEAVISLARKKINKKILESSSFQVPDYEYDKEERRVVHEKYGGDWQQLGLTLEAEGKTMLDWKQNVHSALIDARVNKYLSAKGISITTDEIEQCLSFVDNISDYIWGFYPLQNKNISGVVLEVPEYMPDDYLVISTIRGESAFIEKANQDEFIIDKIAIGGNQVIPDAIIRSEVLFAPGESFNPDLIKQICESILGLGLFCCIKASYEETDVQGRKKLVIVVDELDSLKQRNVAEIIVPEGTKEIEPAKYCLFTKAKEIKIPSSVNKIGNKAFAFCRVATNINIPDNIKSIGNMAFYNCNGITDMKLPDSLQEIGYSSFAYCGLTNAVVTQNMTNPVSAYYGCRNLRTYTVSEANTLFSAIDGVLYSKDKTRLIRFPPSYSKGTYIVPKTCTSIEKYSFESAPNLTNLVIPNNVTNVGKDTFYGLTNKGSVVLPEHLFQKNLHHMWIAPDVVRDAAE